MFVTKAHYNAVIAELRAQIKDRDCRLASELAEKDFYRRTFLANNGFRYPVEEQPKQVAPIPVVEVDEVTKRKTFRLRRDEWTNGDNDQFSKVFVPYTVEQGTPPDECEWAYHKEYGDMPPSVAWRA